jgi:hypothetical protein
MVALGIIGFLAFIVCIVFLILSAIKKKPKRYWAIGMGVSFIFFVVGASSSTPSTPVPTSITYSINQPVIVGSGTYTVLSAQDKGNVLKASESRYYSSLLSFAKDKLIPGRFIEVKFQVENNGRITETFVSAPTLIDNQNREYKIVYEDSEWIPEGINYGIPELQPGIPLQCAAIYEIANNATGLKLKVRDTSATSSKTALIDLGL